MAAIDVKTGVYLPPYSLQKRLQYWLEPSPTSGWEAALQKPLKCPLGYSSPKATLDSCQILKL